MLFLQLGQGVSDFARIGRPHIRKPEHVAPWLRKGHPGRWIAFRQRKNRRTKPLDQVIPILPQLNTVLAGSTLSDPAFLEPAHKRPFMVKGLANWFGERCIKAGALGRARGPRKAGATMGAEYGATAHPLMAIFDWKTIERAEVCLLMFADGGN
jgi:hypothetical protein